MRQNVVRHVKSKAGRAIALLPLDSKACAEDLDPKHGAVVVVLSRRDLVWLQAFFAGLDKGYTRDYRRMQRTVRRNLDAVTTAKIED